MNSGTENYELRPLDYAHSWQELLVTDEDWSALSTETLNWMLVSLYLIREFEDTVLKLYNAGLINGPAHCSNGQEACAVGAIAALRAGDKANGTHRAHHQFLAKTLQYFTPGGLRPREGFSDDVLTLVRRTLAEIMGLKQGYCGGRGGSMHLYHGDAGLIGTNAIVGGGVPLAAGAAWAEKQSGGDGVVITFLGDGAVNIGATLETFNLAAAWKLPVCFFVENNQYAVSTSVAESTGEPRLSARGPAFGMPAYYVDGMNPLAVYLATSRAAEHIRQGLGPVLIEADTYRFTHQAGALPGSAFGYRSKDEEQAWRVRDPVQMISTRMQAMGLIDEQQLSALIEMVAQTMVNAVDELTEPTGVDDGRRIRPSLWPDVNTRSSGVRGDLSELQGVRTEEMNTFTGKLSERKFVDVIAEVMDRRMAEDPRIFTLGEDVHKLRGGSNGTTRGLAEKYPGRILGTPIAEGAFCGLACGVAMDGRFRPVAEIKYADFMWVAADQIFNQIAKARYMYGGKMPVPMVIRTMTATGSGYGTQHCMDPAGIYATSAGLRIVAPSNPFDYVGLINSALRCEDPVVVLEHVELYQQKGPGPIDDLDYFIPFGKARVARTGQAVTVLTYLTMVQKAIQAAESSNVDAEVIDLRTLDRASLDWTTIGDSIRKTNNVLIVEQGAIGPSYGNLLVDEIQRRFFDELDQPITRVVGGEESPSVSKVLELASIPGTHSIEQKLLAMTGLRATASAVS